MNKPGYMEKGLDVGWTFVWAHHIAKWHKTPHIQNRLRPSISFSFSCAWIQRQDTQYGTGRNTSHCSYHLSCTFSPRFPKSKDSLSAEKWYLNEGKKLPLLFYHLHHLARLSSAQRRSQSAITWRWSKICEVWIVKVIPLPYGGSQKDVKRKLVIASNAINFVNIHELLLSCLPCAPLSFKDIFLLKRYVERYHFFCRGNLWN